MALCARPPPSDSDDDTTLELGFWDKEGDDDFDWQKCQPGRGSGLYVRALQLLGMDMAKGVPGNFRKTVKERALKLERN